MNWFAEKAVQVSPATVTAFGIELTTRHGKASELSLLLRIADSLAKGKLEDRIESILYDSKAEVVAIETTSSTGTETDLKAAVDGVVFQFVDHYLFNGSFSAERQANGTS